MALYEYQFGIVVEADDEQAAHAKLSKVMDLLADLDAEGDPSMDGPWEWTSLEGPHA